MASAVATTAASEVLANRMAEAVDRAIIQRYFGVRASTPPPIATPVSSSSASLSSSRQMSTASAASTAAFKNAAPGPEAVRFLSMFGRKATNKTLDPMIAAAFSSAGAP